MLLQFNNRMFEIEMTNFSIPAVGSKINISPNIVEVGQWLTLEVEEVQYSFSLEGGTLLKTHSHGGRGSDGIILKCKQVEESS